MNERPDVASAVAADQDGYRLMSRLHRNCALLTKGEIAAASRIVSAMGLPSHHDPQKNWDTLKCLHHILSMCKPKLPVLDAGSSRSVIGGWLSLLGYRKIFACDLLEKDPQYFADYGISFSVQDITRTSYDDEFFHAVTCISVIEHNVDLDAFCAEMRRVLRPGGRLLISTDYWRDPVNCEGIYPYGPAAGQMHVFTPSELQDFAGIAASHGLAPCTPFDPATQERAIRWERVDREYTFAFLAFRRIG